MAGEPSSGGSSTRYLETACGILSYSQWAPLLAARVPRVERLIFAGGFAGQALDSDFLCRLHAQIAGDLVPAWTGRWRTSDMIVGGHHPPPPHQVPMLALDFTEDLQARMAALAEQPDDRLLESLAFAEGRFLSIHPFLDFNGRVTRLFLQELLHRQRLPPVALVPADPEDEANYLAARRAGDAGDWRALTDVWQRRFERGFQAAP